MANRLREDEKNEKIIRGLLKLPANRRCINCNNLGPQYVCTNFWTFICTNCSGLHREFTHRVKSISMAKFTSQEVSALQEGGNERAKEIYFKEWESQRHSVPDGSNIDRLRDFIKHVYVDRRYTGERNTDKPPRAKADREDSNESRRGDSYRGGSRSPQFDDRYRERLSSGGRNEDRNFRYVYGERSPGYDQGDNKRSPRRFEVVDDRQRDDRFGNRNQNQIFEDRRFPDAVKKPDGSSPNHQKGFDASSPPMIRPVRDILGEETPPLHVGDPPKSNGSRVPDNSARTQRTSSSSSMGSNDENSVQLKRVNSGSLIDFAADPEPPVAAAPQQSVPQQTTSPSANSGDWASFSAAGQQKLPQVAGNASTLESALAQLSAPADNMTNFPVSVADSSPKTKDGGQLPTMQQHQPSLFPAANSQSTNPPFNAPAVGALNNQSWGSSLAQNMQGPFTAPAGHLPQVVTKPPQEMGAGVSFQPTSVEAKPSGRPELPEDLFTAIYPSVSVSVPSWQRGPPPSMVYGMQYPTGVTMPTFPHSSKSANPFDILNEPAAAYAPTFPSMASVQGALPNMSGPSPLLRSSSFGTPSTQWVPPQQSSYQPAMSPSPYMVQQVPSNMPQQLPNNMVTMAHQGTGGPHSEGTVFGATSGMDQFSAARYSYSQPSTPNSFGSVGGNPFG